MNTLGIVVASFAALLAMGTVVLIFREVASDFHAGAEFWMASSRPTEADRWAELTEANPDLAAAFADILAVEDEPTLRQRAIEIPREGTGL